MWPICDACKDREALLKDQKKQTELLKQQNELAKEKMEMEAKASKDERDRIEAEEMEELKQELLEKFIKTSKKFTDKVYEVSKKHPNKIHICFTGFKFDLAIPDENLSVLLNKLFNEGRYIGTEHFFDKKTRIDLDKTAFVEWKKEHKEYYSIFTNENQKYLFQMNPRNKEVLYKTDSIVFLNKNEVDNFEKLIIDQYKYIISNMNPLFIFDINNLEKKTSELEGLLFEVDEKNIFGVEKKMALLAQKMFDELNFNMPEDYFRYIEYLKERGEYSKFLDYEIKIRRILKVDSLKNNELKADDTIISERQETISENKPVDKKGIKQEASSERKPVAKQKKMWLKIVLGVIVSFFALLSLFSVYILIVYPETVYVHENLKTYNNSDLKIKFDKDIQVIKIDDGDKTIKTIEAYNKMTGEAKEVELDLPLYTIYAKKITKNADNGKEIVISYEQSPLGDGLKYLKPSDVISENSPEMNSIIELYKKKYIINNQNEFRGWTFNKSEVIKK